MSISISGSSVILGEDSGASEIVFDLNFRDMANQDLSAGVNELSDGTNLWVTLVDSPPFHKVVNGEGLSARCVTDDQVIVSIDLTGAINAGKPASSPGLYNPRDRLRLIAEVSGTTISGAGVNGDGFYLTIGNGLTVETGTGVFGEPRYLSEGAFTALHIDSNNGNKLTPRTWARVEGTYSEKDYTGQSERAVTAEHTFFIAEVDVRQGSCWTRYSSGSSPMAAYSNGIPTPGDLTTYGRVRLDAAGALAIGSDNSPFTGSVIGNITFWAPVTEVSASLQRLILLRYGDIK